MSAAAFAAADTPALVYGSLKVAVALLAFWVAYKVLYHLYTMTIYDAFFSPLRHLPRPPARSLLFYVAGHILEVSKGEGVDVLVQWAADYARRGHKAFLFKFGPYDRMVLCDPAVVNHVLQHAENYNKETPAYSNMVPLVGEHSILVTSGATHRLYRGLCEPAFRYRQLRELAPAFVAQTQLLVDVWRRAIAAAPAGERRSLGSSSQAAAALPVHTDLTNLTIAIIGVTAFAFDFAPFSDNPSLQLRDFLSLMEAFQLGPSRAFAILRKLPFPWNLKRDRQLRDLNAVVRDIIQRRRREMQTVGLPEQARDLLDLLMCSRDDESGQQMSDSDLADQVQTFLLAGHETTSTSVGWTLLQLARHPDIQARLQAELDQALLADDGATPRPPAADDIDKLPYLRIVYKEALRTIPPVPLVARRAVADDRIGDLLIPAGTDVVVAPGIMHVLDSHWAEPQRFHPERWLDDEQVRRASPAYMPFLHGQRNCIGFRFAELEAKVIIAMLLQNFSFGDCPDIAFRRVMQITQRPTPSFRLAVAIRAPLPAAAGRAGLARATD